MFHPRYLSRRRSSRGAMRVATFRVSILGKENFGHAVGFWSLRRVDEQFAIPCLSPIDATILEACDCALRLSKRSDHTVDPIFISTARSTAQSRKRLEAEDEIIHQGAHARGIAIQLPFGS